MSAGRKPRRRASANTSSRPTSAISTLRTPAAAARRASARPCTICSCPREAAATAPPAGLRAMPDVSQAAFGRAKRLISTVASRAIAAISASSASVSMNTPSPARRGARARRGAPPPRAAPRDSAAPRSSGSRRGSARRRRSAWANRADRAGRRAAGRCDSRKLREARIARCYPGTSSTSTPCTAELSPMSVLSPGLSALTLAPAVSCDGQRPLGAYATPGGTASLISTSSRSAPVALRSVTGSPLAQPAPGRLARVQRDGRGADAAAQLAVVAERRVHQPGRGRRQQPQPARAAAARRRAARAAAGAHPPRRAPRRARSGRSASGSLRRTARAARDRGARCRRARVRPSVTPERREQRARSARRRSPAAPARRSPCRRPGAGRSRCCAARRPGGSTALTWAESVWWKYEATMSSHSRKLAAGRT